MDVLRSFSVFQKVAEHGSFSRAAESLGVVPSAVSRQISELEEWAGLRLINRTTRSLQLTPEGLLYLEKLAYITGEIDDLKGLGVSEKRLVGRIRLTAPMMLGQYILPASLVRFKQAHPDVEIAMTVVNRTVNIIDEGFDLAVRAGHLSDSSLTSIGAGHVRMCMVASSAYLDRHGQPAAPKDLAAHNCLISEPNAEFTRWPCLVDGKEVSIKVRGDLSANDSLCLKALAKAGLGIARLPRNIVSAELAGNSLVEVLPGNAPAPFPVSIVHHYGRQARPTLRAFVSSVAEDLKRMLRDEF